MKSKTIKSALTLIGIVITASARADFCSTPSTSVSPEVTVRVQYDKKTGQYLYHYHIQNERSALLSINRFELLTSGKPTEIHSPEKWNGELVSGVPRIAPYFLWSTLAHVKGMPEVLPSLSPGFPVWAITSYPSFAIRPGSALDDFSFKSDRPPGILQFRAIGFTQDPVYDAKEEYEEGTPNCSGWDFNSNNEDTMVTGMVIGPSEPDVISVPIRVRGEDGIHPAWPVDPHATNKGKVTVLVLSTRDFDAAQVDPKSIEFGPGKAIPIASKLLGRHEGDDRADERENWENQATAVKGDDWRKTDRRNLLLTFDLASLEIQCVIDRAVFLRGKMLDGRSFLGGATTKLLGCDVHHPDVRPDHRKIKQPKKKHKHQG